MQRAGLGLGLRVLKLTTTSAPPAPLWTATTACCTKPALAPPCKVASGLYTSASKVVREALRLLDEQDQVRAVRLEQLRQDVHKGLESGPSEAWDPVAMKQQARTRRAGVKGSAKA